MGVEGPGFQQRLADSSRQQPDAAWVTVFLPLVHRMRLNLSSTSDKNSAGGEDAENPQYLQSTCFLSYVSYRGWP